MFKSSFICRFSFCTYIKSQYASFAPRVPNILATFIFCISPFLLFLFLQFTVCVSIWLFSLHLCIWSCFLDSWQLLGLFSCFFFLYTRSCQVFFSIWNWICVMTFMLGPKQSAGCPGAALSVFRGKESQRFNSSQQVGLFPGPCSVCFSDLMALHWLRSKSIMHASQVVRHLYLEIILDLLLLFVPWLRASTLSSAVSSLANTGMSFSKVDEREKQAALEEEQARLKALKVRFSRTS